MPAAVPHQSEIYRIGFQETGLPLAQQASDALAAGRSRPTAGLWISPCLAPAAASSQSGRARGRGGDPDRGHGPGVAAGSPAAHACVCAAHRPFTVCLARPCELAIRVRGLRVSPGSAHSLKAGAQAHTALSINTSGSRAHGLPSPASPPVQGEPEGCCLCAGLADRLAACRSRHSCRWFDSTTDTQP